VEVFEKRKRVFGLKREKVETFPEKRILSQYVFAASQFAH
jgi:hypothetical protein